MLYSHITSNPCLLCDTQTAANTLTCQACFQDLLRVNNACYQCALPLNAPLKQGDNAATTIQLCGHCLSHPPSFDYAVAAFLYAQPLDYLIRQFKFSNQLLTGYALAKLMLKTLKPSINGQPECLIPVPLHPKKLKSRGYNQAQELAYPIAKSLAINIDLTSCARTKHTQAQSKLAKTDRRSNMKNAFEVIKPISAEHVVLIDDIMTTGNTLNELAKQVKKSGVKTVGVWVCARAVLE